MEIVYYSLLIIRECRPTESCTKMIDSPAMVKHHGNSIIISVAKLRHQLNKKIVIDHVAVTYGMLYIVLIVYTLTIVYFSRLEINKTATNVCRSDRAGRQ